MMISNRPAVAACDVLLVARTLGYKISAIRRAFKGDEDLLKVLVRDIRVQQAKHADEIAQQQNN